MCTPLRFVKLLNLVAKSSRHNGKWGLCEDCLCTALSISIGQQLQLVIQSAYTSLRWAFWWKKSCHPLMKMTEAALFSREFIRRGKTWGVASCESHVMRFIVAREEGRAWKYISISLSCINLCVFVFGCVLYARERGRKRGSMILQTCTLCFYGLWVQ